MANNLRKGSKVILPSGIKGVVIKKYTARKGSVDVPSNKRTLVDVRASGQIWSKRPSELKRR